MCSSDLGPQLDSITVDWLRDKLNGKITELESRDDLIALRQDMIALRDKLGNPGGNSLTAFGLKCFEMARESAGSWRENSQELYSELQNHGVFQ